MVRRIYDLCIAGYGPCKIARILRDEKVLTPCAYYHTVGMSANHPMPADPYLWSDATIEAILANRKYTGCMVNGKTTTVSHKVHKLIRKPEDEWCITPDAQEAIIDENTWLRVQELRKNKDGKFTNRMFVLNASLGNVGPHSEGELWDFVDALAKENMRVFFTGMMRRGGPGGEGRSGGFRGRGWPGAFGARGFGPNRMRIPRRQPEAKEGEKPPQKEQP